MPQSLHGFQAMFARMYPSNTLHESAMHLAEETGEVDEAIEHYMETHDPRLFEEIVIELVDAITNMCAVATCLGFDLATEIEKNFANGFPKCVSIPCTCGFTVAKATR